MRSQLAVPMRRQGDVIGTIALFGRDPGGYGDAEVAMVQAFADQAAIAVDNARLLAEIEERNRDLAASLELQTATSEILELISANPGDLHRVLHGVVEQAASLCDAPTANIMLRQGDILQFEAGIGAPQRLTGRRSRSIERSRTADSRYTFTVFRGRLRCRGNGPDRSRASPTRRVRSMVLVPLFQDDDWIGTLSVIRHEVRPFDVPRPRC